MSTDPVESEMEQQLMAADDLHQESSTTDNGRSEEGSEKEEVSREVIHSSPCSYHVILQIFLLFTFVVNILPLILDPPLFLIVGGIWAVLIALMLPVRFDVLSDASVDMVTLIATYPFPDVVRAYQTDGTIGGGSGPRIKFVTDYGSEVCLRRARGRHDIYVSPRVPEEFVQAVNEAVNRENRRKLQQQQTGDIIHSNGSVGVLNVV
mmetsp:Transcript_11700/g.27073  ORF Transcript_11700/g.27073 Transcript_11700/m.27073 type:complete len:207 (+) Transcript_11700:1150-1770(+)|eukprot:CAMPEP_0116834804 /NCGR_PEP_ID=MMETSP0418-20121206/7190_1 /TAXON_ID=1158023 /ORGANISM="Astrosyne radiata, Strain 13vi08-1A" /LENGTH=206 /DNA_ID=CAMNT_0004464395 /DNA_START=1124 /DNA_END=1744 /DNA_ORIENTATION=+